MVYNHIRPDTTQSQRGVALKATAPAGGAVAADGRSGKNPVPDSGSPLHAKHYYYTPILNSASIKRKIARLPQSGFEPESKA